VLLIGIALGASMGGFIELTVIRPVENKPQLSIVVVTLGLFVFLNSIAGRIWFKNGEPKAFPTPFSDDTIDIGFMNLSYHQVGVLMTALVVSLGMYLLFNGTKLGLAMRATAHNPVASRLMGIRVCWMLTLGWMLAAGVGAIGGMLIAHTATLSPPIMLPVVLYAFAAAVLGGLDSAPGAVLGGFLVGVMENLLGTYTPREAFGPEMKLPLTLLILVLILLVRPNGLLGRGQATRV
jgi:branched-chain amino acid transport system permease protein